MTITIRPHTFEAVLTKLHISREKFLRILERDLVVHISPEEGTDISHKLFYSSPDADWFVAMQDAKTDEIIGVLPYTYNGRWQIPKESLDLARQIMLSSRERRWVSVRISCDVYTREQIWARKSLGHLSLEVAGPEISSDKIFASETFKKTVNQRIAKQFPDTKVAAIYVRVDSHVRFRIDYPVLFPAGRLKP